ncbi:MAG: class I SAM-dependent methyltransferase [Actinomycetota bacterium]|nr:class I SAM-dependent methyltransferase [Actinomycetota bacterium]
MVDRDASAYGDTHAEVYDRIYGARFDPTLAVAALADAAGPGGRVLELGLGTGRLAIPLLRHGLQVDGIEASRAMIDRLHAHPGGTRVGVYRADLAEFDLPRHDYDVAVCAVSTLFMLPGRAAQQGCIASAARHLRPGGRLFIETFRPDPGRFDAAGHRVETRPAPDGGAHVVRSRHDPAQCCIHITHELSDGSGNAAYSVTLHYAPPQQLDQMARLAGLRLIARWHDWTATPANESSADPISIYTLDP